MIPLNVPLVEDNKGDARLAQEPSVKSIRLYVSMS